MKYQKKNITITLLKNRNNVQSEHIIKIQQNISNIKNKIPLLFQGLDIISRIKGAVCALVRDIIKYNGEQFGPIDDKISYHSVFIRFKFI